MKKQYYKPKIELIAFNYSKIVAASGDVEGHGGVIEEEDGEDLLGFFGASSSLGSPAGDDWGADVSAEMGDGANIDTSIGNDSEDGL